MANAIHSADSAPRLDPILSITKPLRPQNCGRVTIAICLGAVG
jgi:hypothetical protein